MRWCSLDDACDTCTIRTPLGAKCDGENGKFLFQFCNPRTKKIDVESSSYLICSEGTYRQRQCSDDGRTHFSATTLECVDPATLTFHAQGTSGSGRVGDVCTFNTDCLSGMYCAIGQCRCLSTYIAVDAYCYERISPSESGCFYDVQCSAVWPDAYCKNGQCQCPSQDMVAVKTRDGTLCLWSSPTEPSCPLPSLPPPDSAAALVVLPAPSAKNTVSIATCNPHASSIPATEELLLTKAHEHKCAVRGSVDDTTPKDVSDLYDCIDNSKFWQGQGLDTNSHPVGVCCMNRACPRGNPAYIATRTDLGQIPQGGCTITQPCADPFECTEVASQSLCCPSRKSICSESGGRSKNPLRSTPYDAGMRFDQLTGEQANYAVGISTRYYYNPIDGQCHPFTYNGFLGNFNNFHTQSDCQIFCARLQCTHGNPLTTGHGVPQRCQRDADCPSTHTCAAEHAVCCPTPQTLCTEPLRVGDCKQSVRQFWYNAETRTCEGFLYTGCQGNNNRFHTLNECQSYCKNINAEPKCPQGRAYVEYTGKFLQCGDGLGGNPCPANYECHFDGHVHGCCPSKAYTCSLQLSKGVACGSGSSYRYYYNNQLKECQSFLFLGCDGNSNNFPTDEKCQSYCEIAVCPNGGSPLRSNSKLRSCATTDPCPVGYECSQVDGNGVTHRRCCPTKASICAKPPQMGMLPKCGSGSGQTRFYFNVALQTCSPYTSNGCDSSLNSFKTLMECEDFCLSAGCKPGDTVYKDPNTNRPFLCNTALQNNCPTNYQCTLNSLTQEHVCCGSDSMGVCPAGEKAFVDPMSSTPRQCAMAADGKCPAGYLCRFSQNNHKYYCCGSISGSLCPAGRALFRYAATQLPLQCSIAHGGGACPPSYSCQSDVPGAFQGYCCSQHPVCPGGVDFHVDEKSQMPTTCTSEGFALCPNGYTCQQQPETINFYCCAGRDKEGINDGCPPSQYAYVADGQVKSCDPFNVDATTCPSEYTCQWSITNQKYQCCGTRPIRQLKPNKIDDGCPRKQFALLDRRNNQPRVCTAGEEKSCPTGFFCQFSAKRGQFQCCGQSGGCPSRRAAFIAIDGNAQECLPGPDMCADGYECVLSAYGNGKNICCSKEENECAENEKMIGGKCVVQVKIGGACHKDAECGGGSKCIAHSCTCASDQDAVNDECVARACESNQIILEGKCVDRAAFGESCKSSLQCVSNMRCLSGRCDCGKGEKAEGNNCVKISEESKKSRPKNNDVCPNESEHAFFERGTTRMRYCSQIADDCPKGYSCQYSDLVKQNICCGEGDGDEEKKPKLGKPKGSTASNPGHCPSGMTPYLLNGKPKSCSSGTCPYGFECKFSSSKKNYYCCSKVMKKTNHLRRDGGCERGAVLLYPATQEPVHCDLKTRGCPNGYLCLPHTATKVLQCCSVQSDKDSSRSMNLEIECPSYMVRVIGQRHGRRASYCARSCPPGQTAVNGVCQ
ncbi:hypothetical protein Y032_0232g3024 [Ancylostoma ceylanicum]|uniref:BPTI/Kunitz inhibitor domain-containing protein n=1 Tax=Ancylostoma ceylanicum TaxID=53326 RepID=A0A016SG98_9BILA|nr:hypothetical protein Y032_0232g3024 [Ancylostoma ceylanicum]